MKRSLIAAALFACAAFACTVFEAVASPFVTVYRMGKELAMAACALAGAAPADLNPACIRIKQAKAFKARLAKRERPELTGSWRVCPST